MTILHHLHLYLIHHLHQEVGLSRSVGAHRCLCVASIAWVALALVWMKMNREVVTLGNQRVQTSLGL